MLAILFAGILPILTGAAYLTGVAYHQSYLGAFGIPPKIIEKTTTDFFVYAHSAVTESLFIIVSSALATLVVVGFLTSFLFQVLKHFEKKARHSGRVNQLRTDWTNRRHVKLLLELLALPAITVLIIVYMVFGLLSALIFPPSLGAATGSQRAKEDLNAFKKDCSVGADNHRYCSEIRENETLIACGYLIDSSPEYIAVFDEGKVRTIPAANKTFLTIDGVLDKCGQRSVSIKDDLSKNKAP
ncbi:hypothetical protein [uncultured Massilia sp.]|uniref:hypothetical protein n=1 Tax=uncultured Massilia sp. TaxID=169973 RepID=UPI0025835A55|nr:hypothetical protein [uncultured Massilia sp.]